MREQAAKEIAQLRFQQAKFIPLIHAREAIMASISSTQLQKATVELQLEDRQVREKVMATAGRLIELCKEAVNLGLVKPGELVDQYYERIFAMKGVDKKYLPEKPLAVLNILAELNNHCETLERKLVIWRDACKEASSKGIGAPSEWKRLYLMNSWSGDHNRVRMWCNLPSEGTVVPISRYNADQYFAEMQEAGLLSGQEPKGLRGYRFLTKAYRFEERSEKALQKTMTEDKVNDQIDSWWRQRHEKLISDEPTRERQARLKRLLRSHGSDLQTLQGVPAEIDQKQKQRFESIFKSSIPETSSDATDTLLGRKRQGGEPAGAGLQEEATAKEPVSAHESTLRKPEARLGISEQEFQSAEAYYSATGNKLKRLAQGASDNLKPLNELHAKLEQEAKRATLIFAQTKDAEWEGKVVKLMARLKGLEEKKAKYLEVIELPNRWDNSRTRWESEGRKLLVEARGAARQLKILEPLLKEREAWARDTEANLLQASQRNARTSLKSILQEQAQLAGKLKNSLGLYVDQLRETKNAFTIWYQGVLANTPPASKEAKCEERVLPNPHKFYLDAAKKELASWCENFPMLVQNQHVKLRELWGQIDAVQDENGATDLINRMVTIDRFLDSVSRRGDSLKKLVRPFEDRGDSRSDSASIGSLSPSESQKQPGSDDDYIFEDGMWRINVDTPERKTKLIKLPHFKGLKLPPEPIHYTPEIQPGHEDIPKALELLAELSKHFKTFGEFDVLAKEYLSVADASCLEMSLVPSDGGAEAPEELEAPTVLHDETKGESHSEMQPTDEDRGLDAEEPEFIGPSIPPTTNINTEPAASLPQEIIDSSDVTPQGADSAVEASVDSRILNERPTEDDVGGDVSGTVSEGSFDRDISSALFADALSGEPHVSQPRSQDEIVLPHDIVQRGGTLFADEFTIRPCPDGSAVVSLQVMIDHTANSIQDRPSIIEVTVPPMLASSDECVKALAKLAQAYSIHRDVLHVLPLQHSMFADLLSLGAISRLENFCLRGIGQYGDGFLDLRLADRAIIKDVIADEPGTVVRLNGCSVELVNVVLDGSILDVSLGDATWRNCLSTPRTVIRGSLGNSIFDEYCSTRWDATRADLSAIEMRGPALQQRLEGMLFRRDKLHADIVSVLSLRDLTVQEWEQEQRRLSKFLGKYRFIKLVDALSSDIEHKPNRAGARTYIAPKEAPLNERYELKLPPKDPQQGISLFVADYQDLRPCRLVLFPNGNTGRRKMTASGVDLWGDESIFYHEALFRLFDLFGGSQLSVPEKKSRRRRGLFSRTPQEESGIWQVGGDVDS